MKMSRFLIVDLGHKVPTELTYEMKRRIERLLKDSMAVPGAGLSVSTEYRHDIETLLEAITRISPDTSGKTEKKDAHAERLLGQPVETLQGLNTRARNCLKAENINTIGDLVKIKEADLAEVPNIGKATLREIRTALQSAGFSML